jgi:hypothetical protein
MPRSLNSPDGRVSLVMADTAYQSRSTTSLSLIKHALNGHAQLRLHLADRQSSPAWPTSCSLREWRAARCEKRATPVPVPAARRTLPPAVPAGHTGHSVPARQQLAGPRPARSRRPAESAARWQTDPPRQWQTEARQVRCPSIPPLGNSWRPCEPLGPGVALLVGHAVAVPRASRATTPVPGRGRGLRAHAGERRC